MNLILIVDDDHKNRYFLQTLLEGNGYRVKGVANGQQALELAERESPVLIVSDLLMPVMDGYALLRKWKSHERLKAIPFVVYTATYTDPDDERLALDLGADLYLVKPAEPEALLAAIQELQAEVDSHLKQPRDPQVAGEQMLEQYSDTLVRKLEEKIRQLEESNQSLEALLMKHQDTLEELRVSEERHRSLFQSITDPLFVYDRESLRYLAVNEAAVAAYGYSREEFLEMTIEDVRPPEDVSRLKQMLAQAGTGMEERGCWRHRTKNGQVLEVEIFTYGLEFLGRPACLVQARNVSEQRRAEAEAARTTALLNAVVNGVDDAVFVKDRDGRYLLFNQAAARFVGKPAENVVGHDDTDVFGPEDAKRIMDNDRQVIESNQVQTVEENLLTAIGPRIFSAHKVPYRDQEGNVIGLIGISRDVTAQREAEAARRETDERFRQLAENIEEVFWLSTPDNSEILYISPSFERIWGLPCSRLYENSALWLESIHPDDRARVESALKLQASGDYNEEYRIVRPDGTVRWIADQGFPIQDDNGNVFRVAGVAEDITERKEATAALLANEARFRLLAKATNDALWDWDLKTQSLWWSEGFETLFGFSRDEIEPTIESWYNRIHSEDREWVVQDVHRAINSGRENWSGEYRFACSNGSYAHVLDRGHVIHDQHGVAVRMVGGMTDLTELKASQETLRLRDRAIQAVSQGILITDATQPDNPIVFASAGFERMTGYNAEETYGKNCRFLQGAKTNPDTIRELREAIAQRRTCEVEILNYRKDGTPFWNQLSISPVYGPAGELTNLVGVQTDVTSRRRLEEQFHQSQKMEAVGKLAGGVAHDFNNLLTVITGYSEMLLGDLSPAHPMRDPVTQIHEAGHRAGALTRQLLTFSRRHVVEPKLLDLNDLVSGTEKMLRRLIGEDVLLQTALSGGLSPVKMDPSHLEQVLLNLAVNARDAMPSGGTLSIATRMTELDETYCNSFPNLAPGRYVLLSVSDDGCGIPDEVKSKIFEPFFTTKEVGKGTGLGLATVHGIVQQSGGNVAVYSEVGNGTTFKVYLPAVQERATESENTPSAAPTPSGTETILIAEDEEAVRNLAARILKGYGYTVHVAAHGKEALEKLQHELEHIDLLVSDVVMPHLGGRALAEEVQQLLPNCKILFLSGYTDDAVIRHGVLDTEFAFLQKPFSPVSLAQRVRRLLDQSKSIDRS